MGLVAGHELADVIAELIVGVGGNVVKLVHGDEAIVQNFDAKLIYGEPKGGVGADQYLGITAEKLLYRIDFAAIFTATVFPWCVAKIPLGFHLPIGPEAELGERLIVKAGADRFLGDDDDRLLEVLVR